MPDVSASRSKVAKSNSLKHKIAGSALILSVVAVVVFGLMEPQENLVSAHKSSDGADKANSSNQPRPELAAVSIQSEQLKNAIQEGVGQAPKQSGSAGDAVASEVQTSGSESSALKQPSQASRIVSKEKPAESIEIVLQPKPVPPKAEKPSSASQEAADNAAQGEWYLQIGAFKRPTNAELLSVEARHIGFSTYLHEVGSGADSLFKLLIGPYPSQREALSEKAQLEQSEFVKKHSIKGVFVVNIESQT